MPLDWISDPAVLEEEGIQVLWERFLAASATRTPFQTPLWARLWWRHFGEGRRLQLGIDPEGGLLPLYREPDGLLRFLGGVDVSDYLDAVAPAEALPDLWGRALADLEGPWDLRDVPQASPTREVLAGAGFREEEEDACPVIPLPESFDAYLASLPGRIRKEVRRKLRAALGEVQARLERFDRPDPEAIETFLSLHRASSPEKRAFMTEQMAAFFRELMELGGAAGWVRLYLLRFFDRPVAACLAFCWDGVLMGYNSGFDPEVLPQYAPGLVIKLLMIREGIEEGLRAFDLLRGKEAYKYTLGARDTFVYRLWRT